MKNIPEKIRQEYLKNMEIECWFPYKNLMHSPDIRYSYADKLINDQCDKPHSKFFNSNVKIPNTLSKNSKKTIDSNKLLVNNGVINKKIQDKNSLMSRCRLVTLLVNEQCLVITDMPYANIELRFAQSHLDLLSDILKSIHQEFNYRKYISEFKWPLGDKGIMTSLQQCDNVGHLSLHAYLENQFSLCKRPLVLLLGQMASKFFLNKPLNFESVRGIHSQIKNRQLITVSYSLHELLQQPKLKYECWNNDIKTLNRLQVKPINN